MVARCLTHQDHEIPAPFVPVYAIEAIPPGFNREGYIPEERGSLYDEIVTEGAGGV